MNECMNYVWMYEWIFLIRRNELVCKFLHDAMGVRRARSVMWHILIRRTVMHARVTNEESARFRRGVRDAKRNPPDISLRCPPAKVLKYDVTCRVHCLSIGRVHFYGVCIFGCVFFAPSKRSFVKIQVKFGWLSPCVQLPKFPIRRSRILSPLAFYPNMIFVIECRIRFYYIII